MKIHNLTHEITPYNIFEASYRLFQTVEYWPEGTTFISVVDPGVGSKRKSVVALTENNQYIVTPDNGTLTYIKTHLKKLDQNCPWMLCSNYLLLKR